MNSEMGQGSTFWFTITLPVTEIGEETRPVLVCDITGYEGVRRTILVADDNPYNRMLLVDMLEPLGFEIITVSDGQEAVDTALQQQPDALVLDLVMPVKTGLEAIRELRAHPECIEAPIIVVSASVMEHDRERSQIAGADAFLPKPVNGDDLLAFLGSCLGLKWICTEAAADEQEPAEALVPPPAEEMEMLLDLARRGDMQRIQKMAASLELLDEKYKPFARKLRNLADTLETKAVLALVKHSMEEQQ